MHVWKTIVHPGLSQIPLVKTLAQMYRVQFEVITENPYIIPVKFKPEMCLRNLIFILEDFKTE